MNTKDSYHRRKQRMFGLLLVAIGAVPLLDQFDMLEMDDLWRLRSMRR